MDIEYIQKLASRMKHAAEWGGGTRSSAWGLVQAIADNMTAYDSLIKMYEGESRNLAVQVAETELDAAPSQIRAYADDIDVETPDDLTVASFEVWLRTLDDETFAQVTNDPSDSVGTRGWYVTDGGKIVGWAGIYGLSEYDYASVEVTEVGGQYVATER